MPSGNVTASVIFQANTQVARDTTANTVSEQLDAPHVAYADPTALGRLSKGEGDWHRWARWDNRCHEIVANAAK